MTVSQEMRWKAELEIIEELGRVPSSREMQKLLLEKKGIEVNHNTVNADLKKDLESLTEKELENQKSGILSTLDTLKAVANEIAMTESDSKLRLQAMNTLTKLEKTRADIVIKFRKANAELSQTEKPIYQVSIGEPRVVKNEMAKKDNESSTSDTEATGTDE
jgi:hypothetical protein